MSLTALQSNVVRISQYTDYAVRVLLYLGARVDERVPTAAIAQAFDISTNHLQKVVRSLGELGHITLHRGVGGGLELARATDQIVIGAVMRSLEGEDQLVECFRPETDRCVVSSACALKRALHQAQDAFYENLDSLTLADLVSGNRGGELRSLTEP